MLNKKGFTIAEVLVSFSLISIILASIISSTVFYRDRLRQEETISQLNDYKNTIVKTIYDDIIDNNIVKAEKCVGVENCVNFIDSNNQSKTMKILEFETSTQTMKRGVYLFYDDVKYMLPDSDLINEYNISPDSDETVSEKVCDFVGGIELDEYDNKIYKVKLSYIHKDIDLPFEILLIIS